MFQKPMRGSVPRHINRRVRVCDEIRTLQSTSRSSAPRVMHTSRVIDKESSPTTTSLQITNSSGSVKVTFGKNHDAVVMGFTHKVYNNRNRLPAHESRPNSKQVLFQYSLAPPSRRLRNSSSNPSYIQPCQRSDHREWMVKKKRGGGGTNPNTDGSLHLSRQTRDPRVPRG